MYMKIFKNENDEMFLILNVINIFYLFLNYINGVKERR